MSEFENLKNKGGYIFISHSHKDIKKIREIRNYIEGKEFEPICFYLRCLSDDDEVLDLIKREIDAREFFLLVDSENARESTWVQTEVEYIKSKHKERLKHVSLDEPEKIYPVLNRLTAGATVYLSYSYRDKSVAKAIYGECLKRDFKVFYDSEYIIPGADYASQAAGAIKEAAGHGCVVTIISGNSVNSALIKKEFNFACAQKAHILSVIVDDVDLPDNLMNCLAATQTYYLKTPVSSAQISEIVDMIDEISLAIINGDE